jgi:hypothetical protein
MELGKKKEEKFSQKPKRNSLNEKKLTQVLGWSEEN